MNHLHCRITVHFELNNYFLNTVHNTKSNQLPTQYFPCPKSSLSYTPLVDIIVMACNGTRFIADGTH